MIGEAVERWLAGVAAGAVALGLAFAGGHIEGANSERAARAAALAKGKVAVAKVEAKGAAISTGIRTDLETKQAVIVKWRTQYLPKEVPVYVTPQDDARCTVNTGAVSLFNAGVAGAEVPAAASGSEQAPSGVALSAFTDAAAYNNNVALELLAEVKAWRAWYPLEAALYDKANAK